MGVLLCSGCDSPGYEPINVPGEQELPQSVVVPIRQLISRVGEVSVINGGFGSAAYYRDGYIYLMTDRGPNIDGAKGEKVFSNPFFVPTIAKFELRNGALQMVELIQIRNRAGQPISGRPNPLDMGGSTGEVPRGIDGSLLDTDPDGLDPEGLVVMSDGTYWVSDEYGPHIVHLDSEGREIERINAFGSDPKLPPVYRRRRANRGMEGLAVTPDEKTLAGIMQSPLYNPSSEVKKTSRICRIICIDLETSKTREYLYILDSPKMANSEITAISNDRFLVLERDGNMPGRDPNCSKLIYMIDISKATDVSQWTQEGMMVGGKTLEQCTPEEIEAAGIVPVTKQLAFDIMSIPNYPHDKPEGVMIINGSQIGIVNDDDFGVSGEKIYEQKLAPLLGADVIDENIIYFVRPMIDLK